MHKCNINAEYILPYIYKLLWHTEKQAFHMPASREDHLPMCLAFRTPICPCRGLIKVEDRVRGKWAGSGRQCTFDCSREARSVQIHSTTKAPEVLSYISREFDVGERFLYQRWHQIREEIQEENTPLKDNIACLHS